MSAIYLKDAWVLLPDRKFARRTISVKDGVIDAVLERNPREFPGEFIDCSRLTILPGLVNSHTHVAMGFFRGLGHGKKDIIETFLFPAEKSLSAELLEPLSYSYIVGGLKSGVTTFVDHYYFSDSIAKAFERLGCRAVVGETIADKSGALPDAKRWLSEKKRLLNWHYSDRITPVVAPHAMDTVSTDLLKDMAAFAKTHKLPLHLHLSQTAGERRRVEKSFKMSPVRLAKKLGILGDKTLAVHMISADKKDLGIFRESGATIGFCPSSQIIYEELAPLADFLQNDIPIALGTDCAACNDGGDIFAELRLAALLIKDRVGRSFDPKKLWSMVGANPAAVLGLQRKIGRIQSSYAADLVFLENSVDVEPSQERLANIVYSYSARHVQHVMVQGKWLVFAGKLQGVSEERLREDYLDAVAEIQRRVHI